MVIVETEERRVLSSPCLRICLNAIIRTRTSLFNAVFRTLRSVSMESVSMRHLRVPPLHLDPVFLPVGPYLLLPHRQLPRVLFIPIVPLIPLNVD